MNMINFSDHDLSELDHVPDDILLAKLVHKVLPFLLVKNQKISNFPDLEQKFPESLNSHLSPVTSMLPCVSDLPRLWAEFMVAAARDSARLILRLTQAKCITTGMARQYALGLKSEPSPTTIPSLIMSLTGGGRSLRI